MLSLRKTFDLIPVRVAAYFGLVIGTLIFINTPIPRGVLRVLIGDDAARPLANSLQNLTRDIFLLLLVSIYFEWVRSRQQIALLGGLNRGMELIQQDIETFSLHEAQRMAVDSMTGAELVTAAANKDMHKPHDTSKLAKLVLSDRSYYDNAYISCRITNVGKSEVSFFQTFTRTASVERLLIAVSEDMARISALLPQNPSLVDAVGLGRGEGGFDNRVDQFVSQLKVYYKDSRGSYRGIKFARLSAAEQAAVLSLPTGIRASEVAVLGPAASLAIPKPVEIRTEFSVDYMLSDHYCYWFADRPMFVRHIQFDGRKLIEEGYRNVTFQPFLPDTEAIAIETESAMLSLTLDTWIVEGHGVCMTW